MGHNWIQRGGNPADRVIVDIEIPEYPLGSTIPRYYYSCSICGSFIISAKDPDPNIRKIEIQRERLSTPGTIISIVLTCEEFIVHQIMEH
jgi:hypothetical protein